MGTKENLRTVNEDDVKQAFAFTDEVVVNYPRRITGGEPCIKAGRRVKEEFEKICDKGSVKVEEFVIHPWSFLKYIPGMVVVYFICAALLYFGYYWVAFAGLALSLFVFIGQFVFYWPLLDPFFPARKAFNISGSIEPEGEVRQQIIISAHHDAAYVFQMLEHIPKLYAPVMMCGVLFLLAAFIISLVASLVSLFGLQLPQWIAVILLVGGIFQLPLLFFTTSQVVPGAGDNMIAVAIAAATGRIFGEAKAGGNNPLTHTRLILASFDAEECGIRGARAYIKAHREELLKTKTYVFNIDTIYHVKALNFMDADLNSTVKLSHEMAQQCVDIAGSLGYKAVVSRMSPGGGSTDAAAFGEAAIAATNLSAMSFNIKDYEQGFVYHTSRDLSKYIEPQAVEASLKIVRQYILEKDSPAS
ncbi:MAG: M28 family peptidase [Dehalococcoidia bacterium]